MTYLEAISLFKARYGRKAFSAQLPKMSDDEILLELSVIQAELQNRYMLVDKRASVTLTPNVDTYLEGSGAGNIPTDLGQIWNVSLNDNLKSKLIPLGLTYQKDTVKPTAKPSAYSLYSTAYNANVLELDTLPDDAYTMYIQYSPNYDIYMGHAGVNTNTVMSDGITSGSFKLPQIFHPLIVEGALANVLGDVTALTIYEGKVKKLVESMPAHFSGDIPYDNGYERSSGRYIISEQGQDLPRNYFG